MFFCFLLFSGCCSFFWFLDSIYQDLPPQGQLHLLGPLRSYSVQKRDLLTWVPTRVYEQLDSIWGSMLLREIVRMSSPSPRLDSLGIRYGQMKPAGSLDVQLFGGRWPDFSDFMWLPLLPWCQKFVELDLFVKSSFRHRDTKTESPEDPWSTVRMLFPSFVHVSWSRQNMNSAKKADPFPI